jgi:hypothetical protein
MNNPQYNHVGILLQQTCAAYPEQYEAYNGRGRGVGYLRLRSGRFRVYFPDLDGELLLDHTFDVDEGKGQFADEIERHEFLHAACVLIKAKLKERIKR